jgi:hypothetical protein
MLYFHTISHGGTAQSYNGNSWLRATSNRGVNGLHVPVLIDGYLVEQWQKASEAKDARNNVCRHVPCVPADESLCVTV